MPKIYELFGYPVDDQSLPVVESRRNAICPFMQTTCDGGGNRFMSEIDLESHKELKEFFTGLSRVSSGICSIQLTESSQPWIICPRRLFYMGKKADDNILKGFVQSKILGKADFSKGLNLGIWSELKIRYSDDEESAAFDYTFDYVIMPLGRVQSTQAVKDSGLEWNSLQKILKDNGYTFKNCNDNLYIEDFPIGNPLIVEVMTSSTSGGNKKKRSCIPQAFEDCILGKTHLAPGINYRQVWARMASQLIVKSQAAISWGGKTIWVLQDLLADYITASTALDLRKFISLHTDEVNILAFSYGNNYKRLIKNKTIPFNEPILYSGPIRNNAGNGEAPCFQDIIMAAVCPPRNVLISALVKKIMANRIKV
jgi:hypothetical protein